MKELIYIQLVGIIINKYTSIDEKAKKLKSIFDKIQKLTKPENGKVYDFDYQLYYFEKLVLNFYQKKLDGNKNEELEQISEQIAETIEFNENMVILSKYL